uniref:Uncharacterized protein n=1 Tax=viral metagenome TaxID=1070528 RepID=A0A6M3LCW5_9ZZZZ
MCIYHVSENIYRTEKRKRKNRMINKEMAEIILKEILPITGSLDIKIDKFTIKGEEWWGILFKKQSQPITKTKLSESGQ